MDFTGFFDDFDVVSGSTRNYFLGGRLSLTFCPVLIDEEWEALLNEMDERYGVFNLTTSIVIHDRAMGNLPHVFTNFVHAENIRLSGSGWETLTCTNFPNSTQYLYLDEVKGLSHDILTDIKRLYLLEKLTLPYELFLLPKWFDSREPVDDYDETIPSLVTLKKLKEVHLISERRQDFSHLRPNWFSILINSPFLRLLEVENAHIEGSHDEMTVLL
jgi:hypothetical protein